MAETRLILGPPGTGKTTALLNYVDSCLKEGIPPNRIAYMGFTRKAADEAISRACERFNMHRKDFPWFRTLHSTAFKLLGLNPHEVMRTADFVEIGKAVKWAAFKNQYSEDIERPPLGGALGDRCVFLYYLHRATGKSLERVLQESDEAEIKINELIFFARTLEKYKQEFGKMDFTDFLDVAQKPLDVDVFILDEAQDLTRQQWKFATMLASKASRKMVAGDDDQAIFQWSGADPGHMQRIKAQREVLPISYRLPRVIHAKADSIARKITGRIPKDWQPRDAEGYMTSLLDAEQASFKDGSWLLLARHQYQLDELEQAALNQGVVYCRDGEWSNQKNFVQAVMTFESLRGGHEEPAARIRKMIPLIGGIKVPPPGKVYKWDDIEWPFEGRPDWLTALNRMSITEREYVRGLRRRGESLVKPGRVMLSTIHGSKGGEADNVLLLTDVSNRTKKSLNKEPNAELRVWYVAASRARERLFHTVPRTQKFFPFND